MMYMVERWKMAAVLVLSLLLAGLAYVGVSRAQIKEEDVDFEVMATVTMKKGDSLSVLAKKYYGDPLKWPLIKDMNKIPNEARIPVGTVIYIPVKDAKRIVKKVEAEIVEKKVAEEDLSAKIAKLQEELRGLKEKSKECEDEKERLSKELKDKDASVKDLEGMLDNVKAALDKMEDKTAKTEAELEAQAREMRAAVKKREEELSQAEEAKDKELQELRSELSRCRGDMARLEALRDELMAKIREAEAVAVKRPRKPVSAERRSTVAAIAIALVGSIIWIASD
jgi:type I site-specific restriction-modification system R (restriction) subunit